MTILSAEAALRRYFADDPATLAALDATQPTDAPVETDKIEPEPRMIRRTVWDKSERAHRADIYCAEYKGGTMDAGHSAVWNRWAREVAEKAIDDVMVPEVQDIAVAMSELASDLDALIDEVTRLRAEVAAMRGAQ